MYSRVYLYVRSYSTVLDDSTFSTKAQRVYVHRDHTQSAIKRVLKSEKWRNVWLREAGTLRGGRARDGGNSGCIMYTTLNGSCILRETSVNYIFSPRRQCLMAPLCTTAGICGGAGARAGAGTLACRCLRMVSMAAAHSTGERRKR